MIRQQLGLVSTLFLIGVLSVFVYDVLIASRDIKGRSIFVKALEDLIFWCSLAVVVFYTIYVLNEGVIRGYELAALFSGMLLFQYSVGKNITKSLKKLFIRCRIKLRIVFTKLNR